jgi:poly(3-hydroxybutyrate) depolymerase
MRVSLLSRVRDPWRFALAVSLFVLVAAMLAASTDQAAQAAGCTQFGNPPQTLNSSPVPMCNAATNGKLLGPWNDSDGTPRYACLYAPAAASATNPLPMLVWIHPSLVTADSIVSTNILSFQNDFSLATGTTGFVVLAPEGRDTTHFYPAPDNTGPGWDNWYRQFSPATVKIGSQSFKENVDAATIDHFIKVVQATKTVLTNKTFVSGWSNGSAMSYIYALNRSNLKSIAVYSAPDPFEAFNDPCPQTPVADKPSSIAQIRVPNPEIKAYQVHNSCDIAGLCPNSELIVSMVGAIGANPDDDVIINDLKQQVGFCDPLCGTNPDGDSSSLLGVTGGTLNHIEWPLTWTEQMLDFLAAHQ